MAAINLVFNGVDNVSQIVSQINQEMQNAEKSAGGLTNKLLRTSSALQIFSFAKNKVDMLTNSVSGLVGEYQHQLEMETRLATVMQARFGASSSTIESMKKVLQEQELVTGYSYEMLTNGAQELATYISNAETLKGLIPVLADMAKQGNVNSEQGMMSYATMLGKVMGGNMGGMSERGYIFTDAEKQAFKLMSEEERLVYLTNVVGSGIGKQAEALNALNPQSVQSISVQLGNMRKELGKTLKPFQDMFQLVTMKWKLVFYEDILKGLQFIQKHINGIVIALGALGVAILAVGVYFAILKREAIASAIATAVAWMVAHAPLIGIISIILLIITAIGLLLAYSEKVFPAIGGFIGGVGGIAQEVGAQLKYIFGSTIEWIVNAFYPLFNFIFTGFEKVSSFIGQVVDKIKEFFGNIKDFIVNAFHKVFDFILSGFNKVAEVASSVSDKVSPVLDETAKNALNSITNALNVEKKWSLGWKDERKGFANAWKEGQLAGSQVGQGISDKFQGAIDKLTGGLKKAVGDGLSQQDNQFKFASDGSLLTSDTSSVDIAQDYKDLLSTKATERFFFKQSNIRPQINIEMNGTNVTAEDVKNEVASVLSDVTNTMTEGLYSNGVA